jgi:hypothetical protein
VTQLPIVVVPAGVQFAILGQKGEALTPIGRRDLSNLLVLQGLYLLRLRDAMGNCEQD